MRGILSVLHSDTEVASALNDSSKIIAPSSSYPFLISLKAQESPLLIVTSSSRGAEDLTEHLSNDSKPHFTKKGGEQLQSIGLSIYVRILQ